MVVKFLIFNLFFSTILLLNQVYADTIFGKPKIVDGDTIHIGKNKIRLHAIDAPEINQKCIKNNINWDCGIESTKFLNSIIGNAQIECITNGKDRYERYIAVCYKDTINLNSQMVLNGWAIAYRYYSLDYIIEEEEAKSKNLGIWSGKFEEPYLFRKKNK